ncbi:ADP-heptose--LPS heptosyltransferase RfaF [Rosenbergiella australiborealis]|uniref:lipopolysaccharide heptosyltransferase II n=1 Tax=Rosenbergiella australiborealis TaxID=1544696 RepID=A0ABS5T4X4_9GAMM|nr:ADP-heptose--LPS heptosyltransferase RfaF [Rosenbergiella australiborealis]MBT0727409.1 ADP-heptose--LPS heptosyltransferase RfaF [Rosenbergiella australiborealis]
MKILVIAPSWVGDMMMSQSLYQTLKAQWPQATIDVMAPAWCRPLLARMPEVNQAIAMPIGHGSLALGDRYKLGKALRHNHYDRAYVLPNSFKSALIPWFAGIKLRTGWLGEMRYGLLNDHRRLDNAAFPLMVERYIALAYEKSNVSRATDLPKPLARPALTVSQREILETAALFSLHADRPLIGFCPGAEFGPAKRWPDYHYAALAKLLIAKGYQVALFGSAKDNEAGAEIIARLSDDEATHCINLAGKTELDQAVVLLAHCHAVVTNDSGLMHVAAALNRPLVALYGPSSPDFTPPLTDKARIIRLITGYHKIRKGESDQGYHQSLINITPQQVASELNDLLANVQEHECAS